MAHHWATKKKIKSKKTEYKHTIMEEQIDLLDSMTPQQADLNSIIRVIGVGGAGSSAVKNMIEVGVKGVNYIIANTDRQALDNNPAPTKVPLGPSITGGLGAGCDPEVGKRCAIESIEEIKKVLSGARMVFVTAGMGGGTGTGAAPVIAQTAKDMGILTVGIVSIPYKREQPRKILAAIDGVIEMEKSSDAVLVVNNDRLRDVYGDMTHREALKRADGVLATATKSLAEIITVYGDSNVDFADVRNALTNSGVALIGTATAKGENRAIEAVKNAVTSPLLNNNDIRGSHWVLVNIFSSEEHEMLESEYDKIMEYVNALAGGDEERFAVKYGTGIDDSLGEELRVTIVAAGFSKSVFLSNDQKVDVVINLSDTKSDEESEARKIDLTDTEPKVKSPNSEILEQIYGEEAQMRKVDNFDIKKLMPTKVYPYEELSKKAVIDEIENIPSYQRRTVVG